MELLRTIWNYQPDPERTRSVKARALRALALFLAVMVCCTIVSRAADTLTIAVVKTAYPQRQAIIHTVEADGSLEAVGKIPVTAEASTMVTQVFVEAGDKVEAGDLLFTVDISSMQQDLRQKQLELQQLQLKLRAQQETDARNKALEEQSFQRATEDLEYTQDKAKRATATALDEMNEARRAVDNYDGDKEDEDAYKEAVKALRAEYRAKIRDYEQALADEAEALSSARRSVNDTLNPTVNIDADSLALDCQLKQMEIAWLQELLATSGQVYAPVEGTVLELNVEAGKMTGSDAAAYLSGEGALRFTAELTAEDLKHVAKGSIVKLTISGDKAAIEGLSIAALTTISGSENQRMTVEIPNGVGVPGQAATAEIRQSGQTYDTCIPLSALYMSDNQYYVFAIRESKTALGLEQTVVSLDVTVLDKNETMAAVNGPLDSSTRIISRTDRALLSGDRVRTENP